MAHCGLVQAQVGSLQVERDQALAKVEQLTPRVEAMNKELVVATAAAKAAAAEVQVLEEELDVARVEVEGLRSDGVGYKKEAAVVARLEQELQEKRSQVGELSEEVKVLTADRNTAVAAKEEKIVALKSSYERAQRSAQGLQLNLDAVHRQLKREEAAQCWLARRIDVG